MRSDPQEKADQEVPGTPHESDSIEIGSLRLSEVIERSVQDARRLESLKGQLADSMRFASTTEQFNAYLDDFESSRTTQQNKDLGERTNRELTSSITLLGYQQRALRSLISEYERIIDQLDQELREVSDIRAFWQLFAETRDNIYSNATLEDRIGSILRDAGQLVSRYKKHLEEELITLNRLIDMQSEVAAELEQDRKFLDGLSSLLDKDRNSLWMSYEGFSASQFRSGAALYISLMSEDLKSSWENLLGTHVLVIGLFFFIYYQCLRTRRQLREKAFNLPEPAARIQEVFEMPLASAVFLTFLFSNLLYLKAPPIVNDISGFVIIGVVYLIAKKLLGNSLLRVIRIFIGCWLVLKVGEILSFESFFGRLLILLLNVFLLYFIFQINRRKDLVAGFKEGRTGQRILWYYLRVLLAVTAASLICYGLGYLNASVYLSSLVVKLTLLSLYLYLWNPIFKTFFSLRLQGNYLSSKQTIAQNREYIRKVANGLINMVTYVVFLYSALRILDLFDPFYEHAWGFLNNPLTLGTLDFTLWDLLLFLIILWASIILSRVVQVLLKNEVLVRARLSKGLPDTLSMLARYLLITLGFFVAITSLGIEMDQLAIIFGAFSVGIGFGLQNIFNNLVSGLILIFERPINIDDTIEIDQVIGNVRNIGIRSSNIRTFDGAEVIVPNGHLISNEVTNWTLSDQNRRIEIVVGVAYGSDVHRVKELLIGILNANPQIYHTPEPLVLFEEFADSSINFRLLFWTENFGEWLKIKSEVHFEINDLFAREGIVIPFPQRDVNLKS